MPQHTAAYLRSFVHLEDLVHSQTSDLPERPAVAFIGRSNVGKSSLMNHLLGRKNLVKVSSTPGKTQMFNFFLVDNAFYFVDLPGYGYAKAPPRFRAEWRAKIDGFLQHYHALQAVFQLLDIRHQPSTEDKEFASIIRSTDLEECYILNKTDKLKKTQIASQTRIIMQHMSSTSQQVFTHSLKDKGSLAPIWKAIHQSIAD